MNLAITFTGEKGPAAASVHGEPAPGETEADFLTRMIPLVVPEAYRASAAVVTREEADAAVSRPGPAQIMTERTHRLALGFDYEFGDARGVHRIGTTPADMAGWDEVTKLALARHATGSTTPIGIVTDTGPVQITPAEWLAILEAANDFRQPIWHASFALQAMDPIPEDFAADHWWQ